MPVSELTKAFISNARQVMDRKGITQTELAEMLRKQQPSINRTLSGEREINLRVVGDFAKALGVSPQKLIQ